LFGRYISYLVVSLLFLACSKYKTEPSFYYWRTSAKLSNTEQNTLSQHAVKTIYMRFFDVDITPETNKPIPVGVIDSVSQFSKQLQIVPVVFITNRTFLNSSDTESLQLAKKVLDKINSLYKTYSELQIDCDWSEKTREKYFLFLQELNKLLPPSCSLSSTIRLHQIKYPNITGVPPVKRGMLMFYNIGNVSNVNEVNSIFNEKIAKKYTAYIKNYELPLDVALPIFRWYVHYRNGKLLSIISKQQMIALTNSRLFTLNKNNTNFKIQNDTLLDNLFLKKGDELRFEAIDDESLIKAAKLLNDNLNKENRRVVLYDLDEINIKYYDDNTFEKVFTVFN